MAQAAARNVSVVDTSGLAQPLAAGASSVDDDAQSLGVITAATGAHAANPETQRSPGDGSNNGTPDHIPVEDTTAASSDGKNNKSEKAIVTDGSSQVEDVTENTKSVDSDMENINGDDQSCEDDESEYEYEDDEGAAFSGFLMTDNTYGTSNSSNNNINNNINNNNMNGTSSSTSPARIVEEESVSAVAASATASSEAVPRKKWREPSRAAVSMSLRAQQETSGSKRRLAQDLYRIMNQDTEEAGFSIAPKSEDCMKNWTIKLFQFDPDSNLAKDMLVVGIDHIELEMKFPDQYPFEPPFVRVVKPRFKRQTGFVMNGALCMELLTKEGWNAVNDIESVIVSIRSLLVVGDGRLQAATELSKTRYETLLATAQQEKPNRSEDGEPEAKKSRSENHQTKKSGLPKNQIGSYTENEAQSAYSHLSDYHKKKGWDNHGWWARKG